MNRKKEGKEMERDKEVMLTKKRSGYVGPLYSRWQLQKKKRKLGKIGKKKNQIYGKRLRPSRGMPALCEKEIAQHEGGEGGGFRKGKRDGKGSRSPRGWKILTNAKRGGFQKG